MIELEKNGFKLKLDKINKIGIICDFPSFPQENNNSKELFDKLENVMFSYRKIIDTLV